MVEMLLCIDRILDVWFIVLDWFFFFFQAEDGIRDLTVTGVQTCALPIFDGLSQIAYGHEVIVDHVLPAPGIASPEVHVGLENVVEASGELVTIRGNASNGGEVVTEAGLVWRGHVGGGEKGRGCGVPTLLRNLHVWPRHVG